MKRIALGMLFFAMYLCAGGDKESLVGSRYVCYVIIDQKSIGGRQSPDDGSSSGSVSPLSVVAVATESKNKLKRSKSSTNLFAFAEGLEKDVCTDDDPTAKIKHGYR